jgi:3-oxoacyl-[acyl-carrier protein] reductase
VIVCDVDSSKASSVADSINAASPNRALAVPGDVTDANYINVLVKKAAEFGGDNKIHYIVNNAGYTWDGVIHKITDKQWDTILAVHNTAPFRLIRAAAPYFRVKDKEARAIVNVSSTSGTHGNAGQANYSLAKAGVVGLTKTIAKEWGPQFGVRVNTVAFGHIDTRLTRAKEDGAFITTPEGQRVALGIPSQQIAGRKGDDAQPYKDIPLGRPGSATEAAASILALCSPLFSYVSGQYVPPTAIIIRPLLTMTAGLSRLPVAEECKFGKKCTQKKWNFLCLVAYEDGLIHLRVSFVLIHTLDQRLPRALQSNPG